MPPLTQHDYRSVIYDSLVCLPPVRPDTPRKNKYHAIGIPDPSFNSGLIRLGEPERQPGDILTLTRPYTLVAIEESIEKSQGIDD